MELNKQIKKYRTSMNLSQEDLAEKVYVTRQTISNWETGKSYPDIHSLLLLSSIFNLSLDQLVKGDLDTMKKEIQKDDIAILNHHGTIFTVLLVVFVISFAPLVYFLGIYGIGIAIVLFVITFMSALKVEKYKKKNNVQTYKEIVAFLNGERLDEITQNREEGKRPYQRFLLAVASGVITFIVVTLSFYLLTIIN